MTHFEVAGQSITFGLAGWVAADNCAETLVELVTNATKSADRAAHRILTRYDGGDGGAEIHYLPIGDALAPSVGGAGIAVDNVTITTNNSQGVAALAGWDGAGSDTYLSKNANGEVEWREVAAPAVEVDGASVVSNATGQLALSGYEAAKQGAVPTKCASGLEWLATSSATNIILAGAGINITDNGGGAITISAQSFDNGGAAASRSLTVVTDVRYDEATHKFQKKTRTLTFKGSLGGEGEWTDVFEAVSHKSEHEQ